ncbi:MAG TPA: phosphoribosylglycinamide formyltransferase [Ktedonobacter sp.]|nr:phosphoribosylglycinamide formyltransferase [Ktedonobacter sp.]
MRPSRIAVLVSGSGSNLQALIDAIELDELHGIEIALVVSNRADAQGLQRALTHKIPSVYLPWKAKEEAEERLASLLDLFSIDLIVLAGWMRIFTPRFIERYPQRIINLHPALLPDSGQGDTVTTSDGSVIPALRGLHVVQRALDAGIKVTGSTVHYVIPEVDAGPVIVRAEVAIREDDTEETLHERIKVVEHRLIVDAVKMVLPIEI